MQPGLLLDERSPEREGSSRVRRGASISARVALHATATPDAIAVVDGSTRLTYADLDRQSSQLAAHLKEAGAGPGCCIGVLLERSAQFVVTALSVLKAGAAYLPLDSSTPSERVAFILSDAQAPLLLTQRGKAAPLPAGPWQVIDLDGEASRIAARTTVAPSIEPAPEDLAYVIYTSGSTGTPKGVEITHANLLNLVDWHQTAFGVSAADRASQVASLGFDAAVWEIWPYLTSGASLHLANEATRRSPQGLRDWLVSEKITISFVPTILSEQLLQASWPADTALRFLLTGADTLRRRPPAGVPFVLVNNYGPTECTVVATSGTVASEGQSDSSPSIGRPIANATALILDDALHAVPAGEVGELCLAGALVGRGYRNNPEMTASRFVTVSPTSGPPLRIYRTGDRARLLPDGEIAFLGRVDDQVKIRGYRIELGEIAACLDRCTGIEGCAVATRDDGEGLVLVAYVIPARDARVTAADLRESLAARLPEYMIPAHYVSIAALPVTANGKLDKAALPAPSVDNLLPLETTATSAIALDPGGDKVQQQVAALVATLLGQTSIDPSDNFFLLGGHSMLGVQLVARIQDLFGVKLTLRQLFNAPTIDALAAEVRRKREGTA